MPSDIPRPKWLIFLLLFIEWILCAVSMLVIVLLIDSVEPTYKRYTPFEYVAMMAEVLLHFIVLLGIGYLTLGLLLAYVFYNREPYVSSVCISTAINILMPSPFIIASWSHGSSIIGTICLIALSPLITAYIVLRIRPFSKWAITVDENEETGKK